MPRSKELKAVSRPETGVRVNPYDPVEVPTNSGFPDEEVFQTHGYGSEELPETSYSENLQGQPMSRRLKLLKTCSMMLIYIGMGLWAGVVSPTSIDMSELYDITLERFVRAASVKSLGLLVGSFTGAFIADKFRAKADFGLFMCNLIGGVTVLVIPWSPNFAVMAIMFLINGICHGTLNVVCSTISLAMWGPAAPTPLHALHMCFTIGSTIAPPITIPFLSSATQDNLTTTEMSDFIDNYHDDNHLSNENHNNSSHYTGKVQISYAIFGAWSVAVSLIFLMMFIKGTPYSSQNDSAKKSKLKDILNPANLAGGNLKFGIYFIISLFLLYLFLNGRDRGMAMYLFVIAHEDVLQMSKPMAALLVTSYNMFIALGRGLGALISHWLPIKPFLFIQLIAAAFLQLMFFFYGLESKASLWVISALFGIASGPTYPSLMSWADRYIEASGLVIAVIDIGLGLGSFIGLWLFGHVYEVNQSVGVFLLGLIYGIIILLILTPLQIISAMHGDRHNNDPGTGTVHISHTQIQDYRVPDEDENSPLLVD